MTMGLAPPHSLTFVFPVAFKALYVMGLKGLVYIINTYVFMEGLVNNRYTLSNKSFVGVGVCVSSCK